jgi:type IV secretion system protein VirB5
VIDVGAITQLIAQAQTLEQQLVIAQNELQQAQAQFASMTGTRGMERLLQGAPRNYLPTSWSEIQGALGNSGGRYGGLSSGIAESIRADAVLSPQQIAALPAGAPQQVRAARGLAALAQNVAREALQTTSGRFDSLQQFIQALPAAGDQKAVLELQARIDAENAMLQNERTKLQSLDQLMRAEAQADREQIWERTVAGHGDFAARFQPIP